METGSNQNQALFLYHKDYSVEVADWRSGKVPGTRLFGLDGFLDPGLEGWSGDYLKLGSPGRMRLLGKLRAFRLFQALWAATHGRRFRVLISAHESHAYWPLALKRLGLIPRPLVILNVALLQDDLVRGPRNFILRRLLPKAHKILSYSSDQPAELVKCFGLEHDRVGFIPLCVDTEFFKPMDLPREDFILSVGTNLGKDFETLVRTVSELPYRTLIITDEPNLARIRSLGPLPGHVTAELGHRPIAQLRELYARARMFVLPLRRVAYSTGQTIALENMSMARPVIVSRIGCMEDYIVDGETGLLVPPSDPAALREKIKYLWENPDQARTLGRNARQAVLARFSLPVYHQNLLKVLLDITGADK